jgi:Domain of unknown function (DUF4112)
MFFARSHIDLHNIRQSVERIGNISDNVIHFGPVKLGLEAVLEFVPFLGEIYSIVAGLLLVIEGVRARVPGTTLMSIAFLIGVRTFLGTGNLVPGIGALGEVAAAAFRAHKISADLIAKAMDDTLYVEGHKGDPEYDDILARVRAGKEKRRVVYLG